MLRRWISYFYFFSSSTREESGNLANQEMEEVSIPHCDCRKLKA